MRQLIHGITIILAGVSVAISATSCGGLLNPMKMPASLESAHIEEGEGFLSKIDFITDSNLGIVYGMVYRDVHQHEGDEIGIVGTRKMIYANPSGNVFDSLDLEYMTAPVNIIDIDRDGLCEFMVRGDRRTLSHTGKTGPRF
jgi:hypothetical protein